MQPHLIWKISRQLWFNAVRWCEKKNQIECTSETIRSIRFVSSNKNQNEQFFTKKKKGGVESLHDENVEFVEKLNDCGVPSKIEGNFLWQMNEYLFLFFFFTYFLFLQKLSFCWNAPCVPCFLFLFAASSQESIQFNRGLCERKRTEIAELQALMWCSHITHHVHVHDVYSFLVVNVFFFFDQNQQQKTKERKWAHIIKDRLLLCPEFQRNHKVFDTAQTFFCFFGLLAVYILNFETLPINWIKLIQR